jgi:glycosyltransferase involved in cell wall biosynthesis
MVLQFAIVHDASDNCGGVTMYEISIVIPVRDEEKNINDLIQRIFATVESLHKTFEIIFVTDINRDNTMDLLDACAKQHPNIKVLKLSNSFGQHVAVMAGLDHCLGKYTIIMDGDLQDYPEDIPLLYNKICEGYDVVYARKDKKNEGILRNLSSRIFNGLMNSLSDIKIDSNSSMFRIISRKARAEVIKFREYEPSLTYIFSFINLPTATVKVTSGVRKQGKTKYSFFKLVNFAISSLLSFSRKPLRMISNFGYIVSLVSLIYFVVVLYQYFFFGIPILGWATIVAIITFIGGIQLLSIGVIGEYIGRIYMQTKNRPLYIIERRFGNFDQ